jgi:UDP-N-acetylmuramoylalanine--D-glutamate ligase
MKISILGAGESGTGAAVLAKKKGFEIFLSDNGKIAPEYREVLKKFEIDFEEGGHTAEKVLDASEIIKSPGIPGTVPIVMEAVKRKIPVISEIEFAGRFTRAKKICITGSNGKTTTTMLIYRILKDAGLHAALAGNIGKSFAMQVVEAKHDFDYYVLEISSFQLDGMFEFKADIAILTNITPDHLDRYDNKFEHYINSKFRILQNMTDQDAFIYVEDDPVTKAEVKKRKVIPAKYPVTLKNAPKEQGAWLEGNKMIIKTNKNKFDMTIEELALQGKHNVYNSMAAAVTANLLAIRKESVKQSLSGFENLPHRLEYVANVHGITFINDSKATNINSTWYALEQMDAPTVWIAGGQDKGNDYSQLMSLVQQKVKAIVCLGKDNSKLHEAFGDVVNTMVDAASADEAVMLAYELAKKGDIVLLSPACASFDLFDNYQDRGDQFKNAVRAL